MNTNPEIKNLAGGAPATAGGHPPCPIYLSSESVRLTPRGGIDWKGIVRAMHLKQATFWEESARHWRTVSAKALVKNHVNLAAQALNIASMEEGFAEQELREANKLGALETELTRDTTFTN